MGIYATTTSISLIIPGFFISNTSSSDSEGLLIASKHIDRAESQVHAALANKYSLPFSPIPPYVTKIVEDIAVYNILRATGARQGQINEYQTEFEKAVSDLSLINKGEIALTFESGTTVSILASNRMLSSSENHELIMNQDDPKNWKVSKNEADDISGTRD